MEQVTDSMKKNLKILAVVAMLLAALLAAGCGSGESALQLSDMETVEYNNPQSGATITIPADWQVQSEEGGTTVFTNPEGSISFVLKWELGGMSYFSKEELAGLAADVCSSTLENPQAYASLELNQFDVAVKTVFSGTVKNGEADVNAVCDTAIIQYFNDVRYYLVAVTDAGAYAEYENVFTQIANSFSCSLTEDEVYEKLNAYNESLKEQQKAAESDENEQATDNKQENQQENQQDSEQ